jgi:hypothetical protein
MVDQDCEMADIFVSHFLVGDQIGVEATQNPHHPHTQKKSTENRNMVRSIFYCSVSLIVQLQHSKQLVTTMDI